MKQTVLLFAAAMGLVSTAAAQDTPPLQANQAYVEDLARPTTLDVTDLMAVFGFVWAKLPERVKVYPTENYYYVGFFHNGIRYAGNIRLDASNRDDGKVIFAYFEDTSQWFENSEVKYRMLRTFQIKLFTRHSLKISKSFCSAINRCIASTFRKPNNE